MLEWREGWVEATLHRPKALNAINDEMVEDLSSALDEMEGREGLRGLILVGAGEKVFVAGADIKALLARGRKEALQRINAALFDRVASLPFPVIAAIRGFALGGGCELAMAADIRIGGESAKMGQPEVGLGIVPGAGGCHRLARLVGSGLAKELIFTGRVVEAREALRMGLLNRVVPDEVVMDVSRRMMGTIIKRAAGAIREAKWLLALAAEPPARFAQEEAEAQARCFESEEKRARMARFIERRGA